MFRRQFVQLITFAGAGSLAAMAGAESTDTKTVTYQVKGFSCATCAVGLDAMLQKQKGVKWSQSTYPQGTVIIKFDPKQGTDQSLRAFIASAGFTVDDESSGENKLQNLEARK
jgi:copper chaperone CopZ